MGFLQRKTGIVWEHRVRKLICVPMLGEFKVFYHFTVCILTMSHQRLSTVTLLYWTEVGPMGASGYCSESPWILLRGCLFRNELFLKQRHKREVLKEWLSCHIWHLSDKWKRGRYYVLLSLLFLGFRLYFCNLESYSVKGIPIGLIRLKPNVFNFDCCPK